MALASGDKKDGDATIGAPGEIPRAGLGWVLTAARATRAASARVPAAAARAAIAAVLAAARRPAIAAARGLRAGPAAPA
jgi:hypothetical protein